MPSDGWDITLNGAWINAEISKDDVITGEDGVIVAEVANGTQLPISPEYKASVAVQYSFNSQLWGADPYVRSRLVLCRRFGKLPGWHRVHRVHPGAD